MKNFAEFWPFYLGEHRHPLNRKLHFLGTLLVHLLLAGIILTGRYLWFWMLPLVGYSFAWIGHFVIEKNRPATFKYPLWSLMGDFKMFYLTLLGRKF